MSKFARPRGSVHAESQKHFLNKKKGKKERKKENRSRCDCAALWDQRAIGEKNKQKITKQKKKPASPPRRPLQSPWRRRLVFQAARHLRMRGTDLTTLCDSLQSGGAADPQCCGGAAQSSPRPRCGASVDPLAVRCSFRRTDFDEGFSSKCTRGRSNPSPVTPSGFFFSFLPHSFDF